MTTTTSLYKEHLNREKAVRLSAELLRDTGTALFPLNIEQMLRRSFSHQIRLCPYFATGKENPSDEKARVSDLRQLSNDGFCLCVRDTLIDLGPRTFTGNMWTVYYNDAGRPKRIRFTLLHELGHIFLGHQQLPGMDPTSGIKNKPEYREADAQADLFAINALAPAPAMAKLLKEHGFTYSESRREWTITNRNAVCLRNLGQVPDAVHLVKTAFQISSAAASRRLSELNGELKIWEALDPELYASTEQIGHRSGWYCWACHTRRRTSSLYCTGCGSSQSYEYRDFELPSRPVIRLKKNGQFEFCSVCGNTDYPINAKYCPVCGAPLINDCLNAEYTDGDFIRSGRPVIRGTHHCKPTDIYCGQCGVLTAFGERHGPRENLWLPVNGSDRCRFAGTAYPPVLEADARKLKVCPACGSKNTVLDGKFCADCRLPLMNYCTGYEDGTHACMPENRYCAVCGQPTFFYKAGFLPKYTQTEAFHSLLERETRNGSQSTPQMIIHADGSWEPLYREEA